MAGEHPVALRVVHGYSRDHWPDLKRWVVNLVCADRGGIPLLYAPGDGNPSDREALVSLVARYRGFLDLGEVVVLDGASYSWGNLRALDGFSWILRVPATLKKAQALLRAEKDLFGARFSPGKAALAHGVRMHRPNGFCKASPQLVGLPCKGQEDGCISLS